MNYLDHLAKDKKLSKVISVHDPVRLARHTDVFYYLCCSIMSQQLSTAVASVLHSRFLKLFDGSKPTPDRLLECKPEQIRAIGLSNAKVLYVRNIAEFARTEGLTYKQLQQMGDQEAIDHLTRIKGVGRWTAEMLLMFALQREDVFPKDDLGIQQAMTGLYKLDCDNKKSLLEQMDRIAARWSPFRTYASIYLWKWKDEVKKSAQAKKN